MSTARTDTLSSRWYRRLPVCDFADCPFNGAAQITAVWAAIVSDVQIVASTILASGEI